MLTGNTNNKKQKFCKASINNIIIFVFGGALSQENLPFGFPSTVRHNNTVALELGARRIRVLIQDLEKLYKALKKNADQLENTGLLRTI